MNQNYQRIKVLLIDDGSTDGSFKLCDELARESDRVIVIYQKNSGVSAARNTGIEYIAATYNTGRESSYIAFLDADDVWMPDFFNKEIHECLMKGYDLLGGQSCLADSKLTYRSRPVALAQGEYFGGIDSVWIHATQHFGAMFYKVSFLESYKIRFKPLKYSEDKFFPMTCLYLAKRIYLANIVMYLYRQNPASVLHKREYGISYFKPLIEEYLKFDNEMIFWKKDNREFHEGTVLAKWYLMDMLEEHFQHRGTKKQLEEFFDRNPDYRELMKNGPSITRFL